MNNLSRFLKPYLKQLLTGPAFKLFEAVLEILVPTIMAKHLIDIGVANGDSAYILKTGAVMLLLAFTGLGSALVCQYNASVASQGFGTDLRNAVFEHMGELSQREIDKFGAAGILNRITTDINQLQTAVAMVIRLAIRAPFIIIGSFVMAMLINFKLGLIILACTPVFALVIWLIMRVTIPLYRKIQLKLDSVSGKAAEMLGGVRVVRAFAKEQAEEKSFRREAEEFEKLSVRALKISAVLNPATVFILNFLVIGILWAGGVQVNAGSMTQGDMVAFTTYISYIMTALLVFANLILLFTRAAASASRVSEFLKTESSLKDNGSEERLTQSDIALEFKGVTFSYGGSENALEDISFKLGAGESLGIIGGIGSGKSTLAGLISRFYDVTDGEILFFGKDIKSYSLSFLRKNVSIALQKPVIFSGTVAENIRQGRQEADDEEVAAAARIAQADEFVSALNDGYNSRCEAEGKNFSGGQRQRIGIARAVVKNAPLLILDDSYSALDFVTGLRVGKALKEKYENKNLIIISQRVSDVRDCNKILVLDDGRLVGYASHRELLNSCPEYVQIYTSQTKEEVGE